MEGDHLSMDVELFIEEIKLHRSIWDVRSEEYKDRGTKQSAWEEVCCNTFLDFQTKLENEKSAIIKRMALKWKNIKDNYTRNLKKKIKSGNVKKYVYAKHLSFLHELALDQKQSSTEEPSVDSAVTQPSEKCESPPDPLASSISATPRPSSAVRKLSSRRPEESSSIQSNNPLVEKPNTHKLFFDSLIPLINNFTEDQTLQFRIEVIDLIRGIRRQENAACKSQNPLESNTFSSQPIN